MKYLFVLLLAAIGNAAYSQPANFAVKGGLNVSTIGGDARGVDVRTGYHVGIKSIYEVDDRVSLQPEALFSLQGATAIDGSLGFRYEYINVPVLFTYTARPVFYQFGPQFGHIINAQVIQTSTGGKSDATARVNEFDFSLVFGVGFFVAENWGLEGRFNLGLSNTSDNLIVVDGTFPNRVVQFSLFYLLDK